MTVGELIEQLQELDPDLVVVIKQGKSFYLEAKGATPGTFEEEENEFEADEDETGGNDAVLIG